MKKSCMNKNCVPNYDENRLCTHCERPGHDYNSCHTRHKHKEKANVVSTTVNNDSSSDSEHTFMVMSASHSPHDSSERNTWYINTVASQHFMCNCEFLHNFIMRWCVSQAG